MGFKGLAGKLKDFFFPSIEEETEEMSRKDTRPIKDVIDGMIGRYEERVKPLIDSGKYFAASYELRDIHAYWQFRAQELFSKVHSGLSYFSSMGQLVDALEKATEIPKDALEHFEAYQAQTKLPSQEDLAEK